jgi:hypothetical protein
MTSAARNAIIAALTNTSNQLEKVIASRNSEYYFFVKSGLIGSRSEIPLTCMCATTRNWEPPHESSELFCASCGSSFKLMEIDGDGGYVITSNGPARIIGSDAPEFGDLPESEQKEILKRCEAASTQTSK